MKTSTWIGLLAALIASPAFCQERVESPASAVYSTVGPAVVVVRAGSGYGTGFLIDQEGWIVTNQHIATMGLVDLETGARVVDIHFGRYEDRLMHVDRQAYRAVVQATDEKRDLALLRLTQRPTYLSEIKPIPLAKVNGAPGDRCIAIGHPAAGLLWTLRSGEVTGVGEWPQEHMDTMIASLVATGAKQGPPVVSQDGLPQRRVLLSTCPINPGDSGGPLLNRDGELLGITFGIPRGGADREISLDKFSYHVHVDELKAFLESRPETPEIVVPSPWAPVAFSELQDSDNDGRWDTWSFSLKQGENKTGIMFDLDQDTRQAFKESYATDTERRTGWDFEFAITFTPVVRTFYDTDNDGELDLILVDVDRDKIADLALARNGSSWQRIEAKEQRMIDPGLFKQEALRARFELMLK